MALGFPWKKKSRTEEEGGGEDLNCMFHLGFLTRPPKQWPHFRANFVSMRGQRGGEPKGRGVAGARGDPTSVDVSIERPVAWKLLYTQRPDTVVSTMSPPNPDMNPVQTRSSHGDRLNLGPEHTLGGRVLGPSFMKNYTSQPECAPLTFLTSDTLLQPPAVEPGSLLLDLS